MKRDILQKTGIITDFQRFSLHDGPGIRMTVFLKGCNMHCEWCHNPETIYPQPEFILNPEKCIHCGMCESGCFSGAKIQVGKNMTVEQVLEEIEQEQPYFGTDGGITISGGEPSVQPDFTMALLMACKERGIHTAVETNMSLPQKILQPLWQNADLILADIKLWDDETHRKWTGVGNEQIKRNIKACSEDGIPLIIHTPVVNEVNATIEEISAIGQFASMMDSLEFYELLPYHPLGLSKGKLEHEFVQRRFTRPDMEQLEKLALAAAEWGIEVRVAGKIISRKGGIKSWK